MGVGEKLKEVSKQQRKKEQWIKTRMWFSTLMSALYPDRGTIPDNIGNNIFIGNNQYVTKNSISSVILVREFSEETPIGFMSKLIKDVKTKVEGVAIDFTVKNTPYYIDLASGGLKSRMNQWMDTLDNEHASDKSKARAARLLYTVDVARKKEKIFRSHVYITIRAINGGKLRSALSATKGFLDDYNASYKVIKSDLKTHLEYMAFMSDKRTEKLRDIPYNVMSALTLSEILPVTQGLNDSRGNYLGIDRTNRSPYFIDFRASAKAKNIYLVGLSGFGKTFLALNWILDAYAIGYNLCLMDLKGNEFTEFTKACNGKVLSMRPNSTRYVNTFVMKNTGQEDPVVYFKERFSLSKMKLLIIADLAGTSASRGESLIEEFLQALYMGRGVLEDNPNTWTRTLDLNPYKVFDEFRRYLSKDIKIAYSDVAEKILTRFKIYLDRHGSHSHMFRDEYNYEEILDTKVLTFDFGMLNSSRVQDPCMFKLRVLDMKLLNNEFIRHKKAKGEWTLKVLEESQIAEDYLIQIYKEEMTLRRAQNQVTVLLGNSVSALADNPAAKPILENINVLCIGVVHKSSREYLVNEFGLEEHESKLVNIAIDPEYENTFLLVNRMQKNATTAMLKAFVPPRVANGKIFRVVDTEVEEDA